MRPAFAVLLACCALGAAGFTAPLQPWRSPDGEVQLLRPAVARIEPLDGAVGALTSPGWRLIWDGSASTPGRLLLRLAIPVASAPPETRRTEYLQIGVGRGAAALRSCRTYGLGGGSAQRLADRTIQGRRFTVWRNGDAGMSQQISALDLRTVANGACYAIERYSYSDSASDPSAGPMASQAAGAAQLDAALASLRLGDARSLRPRALALPPGAVAR